MKCRLLCRDVSIGEFSSILRHTYGAVIYTFEHLSLGLSRAEFDIREDSFLSFVLTYGLVRKDYSSQENRMEKGIVSDWKSIYKNAEVVRLWVVG